MVPPGHYGEIFKRIIEAVTIYMMNVLGTVKTSADILLNDAPMFGSVVGVSKPLCDLDPTIAIPLMRVPYGFPRAARHQCFSKILCVLRSACFAGHATAYVFVMVRISIRLVKAHFLSGFRGFAATFQGLGLLATSLYGWGFTFQGICDFQSSFFRHCMSLHPFGCGFALVCRQRPFLAHAAHSKRNVERKPVTTGYSS